MKIIVINSNMNQDNTDFDAGIAEIAQSLSKRHTVNKYMLRDMDIHQCSGCFSCLVKTPGSCIYKDDMAQILRVYINSDVAVFASPIIMGFVNAMLKRVIDRLMPLFHAHLRIHRNIFYHSLRYKTFPKIVLLLDYNSNHDAEDVEIIDEIFRQKELNYSKIILTDQTAGRIVNEINNL